jgi:hypothetical protein
MKAAIIQSNYLPWKGYFDIIHDADVFCFYDEVKYTKNDWRNRNRIYDSHGLHWLTIPIYKEAVKQKISEVSFKDPAWQDAHYTVLQNTYRKAPYYTQLEGLMEKWYRQKGWQKLSEMNQALIKDISSFLGIRTKFVNSADYQLQGDRVERLINLLKKLGATEYISGPAARNYLTGSEDLFRSAGIGLTYKDYRGYPEYRQLGDSFEPYVSIADMIANISIDQIPWHIWGWRKNYSQTEHL